MVNSTPFEIRERLLDMAFSYYRQRSDIMFTMAAEMARQSVYDEHGGHPTIATIDQFIEKARDLCNVDMDQVSKLVHEFDAFVSNPATKK